MAGDVRWFRGEPRWWILALAFLCAVVSAVLAATQGPLWLAGTVAALGFVGSEGAKYLHGRLDQVDERQRILRESTLGLEWPAAGTVSPIDMGARRPLVEVDYRPRPELEEEIRQALGRKEAVLLVGSSMVGKTRVAAEVVRRDYPGLPLCRPAVPDGLGQLLKHGIPEGCVVFLDELERHVTSADLHVDWVDRLLAGSNVVVATIRRTAMEGFAAQGSVRHPQSRVVQEAFRIIEVTDSPESNSTLAATFEDPRISEGVKRYGIGPYLGGAHRALGRFRDGQDSHPLGVAVVRSASDWRRLGFEDMPADILSKLVHEYLPPERRYDSAETFDEALAWARAREDEVVQLLEVVGPDRFRCSNYIHDHLSQRKDGARSPVPSAVWTAAAASVRGPIQEYQVAIRALEEQRPDVALELLQRASTSSRPDIAAMALVNLAFVHREQGNVPAARDAFVRAIESGHPQVVPLAAFGLGFLEQRYGAPEAARDAFSKVIDSGDADKAAEASFSLGVFEQEQGDLEAARTAYRGTIKSRHPDAGPMAAFNLGKLEAEQGHLDAARDAYQEAVASGHPEAAPRSAAALERLAQGGSGGPR